MLVLGMVVMVVGALVAVAEAHYPAHGIAGGVGALAMGVGAVLVLTALGTGVVLGLLAGLVLASGGVCVLALTVREGGKARRRRVRGGAEGLVGQIGVVRQWEGARGRVSLEGGLWQARQSPSTSPLDDEDLPALASGDQVVVERLDGLVLSVRRAEEWELL